MQQRPVVGAIATALLVVLCGLSPAQAMSWSAPVVLTARQGADSRATIGVDRAATRRWWPTTSETATARWSRHAAPPTAARAGSRR